MMDYFEANDNALPCSNDGQFRDVNVDAGLLYQEKSL